MNINIAYCVDIQGVGALQFHNQLICSIYSLKKNKKSEDKITVYLIYANITNELIISLFKLQSDDFRIETCKLPSHELNFLQSFTRHRPESVARPWSGIVYARLFLPWYLPESIDKILYIDIDTLIRGSLDELYNTDLKNNPLGMVMGVVPEYGYNSGVILFDLKKIRSMPNVKDELIDHLRKYSIRYFLPDQTTINRFYANQITDLDFKYNYPPAPGTLGSDLINLGNAVIWHFYNQSTKPFVFDDQGISLVEWNKYISEYYKINNTTNNEVNKNE